MRLPLAICLAGLLTRLAAADPVIWRVDRPESIGGLATEVLGAPRIVKESAGTSVWFNGSSDGLLLPVNPLAGSPAFTIEILFHPEEGGLEAQRFFHLQDAKTWRVMIETRLDGKGGWWLDTFLGNPTGGTNPLVSTTEAYWLRQANTWYTSGGASTFDFSRWTIVTDVNAAGSVSGRGTQEFLTTGVAPEPETWLLLGTGLLLIVGFAIKRGQFV